MGLKKGTTNNPNGRKKGVPNKISIDLRQAINDFAQSNFNQLQKDFEVLEPKDRVKFYLDLLKYTLPTLQSTQVGIDYDFDRMTDAQLDKIIENLNNIPQ